MQTSQLSPAKTLAWVVHEYGYYIAGKIKMDFALCNIMVSFPISSHIYFLILVYICMYICNSTYVIVVTQVQVLCLPDMYAQA